MKPNRSNSQTNLVAGSWLLMIMFLALIPLNFLYASPNGRFHCRPNQLTNIRRPNDIEDSSAIRLHEVLRDRYLRFTSDHAPVWTSFVTN